MCVRGRIPFVNAGHPFQQGAIFVLPQNYGQNNGSLTKPIFSNIEQRPGFPKLNHTSFITLITSALKPADPEQSAAIKKKMRRSSSTIKMRH